MKLTPLFFFFFFVVSVNSFDITRLLGKYPEFSTFNNYLTQTNLASQINSRNTITVLAVDETAAFGFGGLPQDALKKVLSLHVILDYYDTEKINAVKEKTTLLTTLFQSTGLANGQQGFLNMTLSNSKVSFASAVPGSPHNSTLVKSVVAKPFNISILQISLPIIPLSVVNGDSSTPPPSPVPVAGPKTALAGAPKKAPAGAPKKAPAGAPAQSPSEASPPSPVAPSPSDSDADAPSPSDDALAPLPEDSSPALAPGAESPEGPIPSELPSDQLDGPTASPSETPSSGIRVVFSACLSLALGIFYLAAM